jgi:hypothetical protein
MIGKLVVAAFLLAHAAIHASFLSPAPPATANGPAWPFRLDESVILSPLGTSPAVLRPLGIALVALVLGGFGVAALSVLGVAPPGLLQPAATAGAVASVALLVLYFHVWLVLGIVIDLGILWLAFGEWTPG